MARLCAYVYYCCARDQNRPLLLALRCAESPQRAMPISLQTKGSPSISSLRRRECASEPVITFNDYLDSWALSPCLIGGQRSSDCYFRSSFARPLFLNAHSLSGLSSALRWLLEEPFGLRDTSEINAVPSWTSREHSAVE